MGEGIRKPPRRFPRGVLYSFNINRKVKLEFVACVILCFDLVVRNVEDDSRDIVVAVQENVSVSSLLVLSLRLILSILYMTITNAIDSTAAAAVRSLSYISLDVCSVWFVPPVSKFFRTSNRYAKCIAGTHGTRTVCAFLHRRTVIFIV